jgi:hypothetical protein
MNTEKLSLEVPVSAMFKAVDHTPTKFCLEISVPVTVIKLTGKQSGDAGFAEFKSVF